MSEVRRTAVIEAGGTLHLTQLPLAPGEQVVVVIQPTPAAAQPAEKYPLHGMLRKYDDPLLPVGDADWESAQ
jgi:hypothetical protein